MTNIIKSLNTLIKELNYKIENVRKDLQLLESQIQIRHSIIEQNNKNINTEMLISSNSTGISFYLQNYIKTTKLKNVELNTEINSLVDKKNEIEDVLRNYFKEQKTLETLLKKEQEKIYAEIKANETKQMDEIALRKYQFKNNKKYN